MLGMKIAFTDLLSGKLMTLFSTDIIVSPRFHRTTNPSSLSTKQGNLKKRSCLGHIYHKKPKGKSKKLLFILNWTSVNVRQIIPGLAHTMKYQTKLYFKLIFTFEF